MHSDATVDRVVTIDCQYMGEPERAAAYLVVGGNQAAFIDNNTSRAVPLLLQALADEELEPDAVRHIIITHLHLDHAGGTAALLAACPQAEVLCHPLAVRHLVDPSRLVAGARRVYGDAQFNELYGVIEPIDEERIRAVGDGERIPLGSRVLTFLHTLGHAKHHICIHDSGVNGIFTGDMLGVSYRPSRESERPFLLCSAAPPDFDVEKTRKSVDRLVATGADVAFLAHFGELPLADAAAVQRESIDAMEAIVAEAAASPLAESALPAFCQARLPESIASHAAACGARLDEADSRRLENDINIDSQGLALAAARMRSE